MGYSDLFRAVLILTCISHIHSQYYDFFQAFQPFVQSQSSQPFNILNDFTTRRPKPKQKLVSDVRHEENTRRLDRVQISDNKNNNDNIRKAAEERNKQTTRRKPTNAFDFNFYTTTQRTTRKTTKAPQRKTPNRTEQLSSIVFFEEPKKFVRPITSITREIDTKPKARPGNRKQENYDSSWYDGRNTVNYYTTKPPYETTKTYYQQGNKKNNNYYTTHNPLLNRPGVRPAVVQGPPITNRPVTQRPGIDKVINIDDDLSISPEVISGPDEDYMSAVEKKRYIEIADRMCDKYKSLSTKQVEAIPLLPSPQPVRVNVSSCPPTNVPLVVGGKVVTIEEFPHMALLGWRKKSRGYSWKCGGSLLSNQHILTAAHCAYQDKDDNVIAGPPRIIQLGSSFLNDPGAVYMRVGSVTRHPKYRVPKAYYDLAIVKMAGIVTFSDVIKPACLGTPPPPNNPVIATGWGRTEFGGSLSHELRSVSIPVWDLSECHNALGVSVKIPYGPSSDSQICAGERRGGKDTCQGDSGGPAQIQDGCTWRVVAVTSVGRYCGAPDTPAIYAIVQKPFISAVVWGKDTNDNTNRDTASNDWNKKQNNQANDWNNRKQQTTNTNQQSSQTSNNNDWNNKRQPSNTNQQTSQTSNNNDWNNKKQQTANQQSSQTSNNDWNNKRQQSTNQQSSQTGNNNDWNNKKKQTSNTNQQYSPVTSSNNDWNNKRQQTSTTNQQSNNNWQTGNNNWNSRPSDTGIDNYGNNRETYNWNNDRNQAYSSNSQPNRNEYNNNYYNSQTTENYYNPSPSRVPEVVEGQYYNNYAGSNNFNNYNKQPDYNNNNGGNVWWT